MKKSGLLAAFIFIPMLIFSSCTSEKSSNINLTANNISETFNTDQPVKLSEQTKPQQSYSLSYTVSTATASPKLTPVVQTTSVDPNSKEGIEAYINGKNFPSSTSYFIWIDLKKQKVNVFTGSNHNWKLVKSMACSSGKPSTPTKRGNFKVGNKGSYFTTNYAIGGKTIVVRCKYFTQISGHYLFHSIIYDRTGTKVVDGTLGTPRSHGCVRLAVENAKYIYDTIPRGTAIWSN